MVLRLVPDDCHVSGTGSHFSRASNLRVVTQWQDILLHGFCSGYGLMSEASFEKVFRTQNWVGRRKLF